MKQTKNSSVNISTLRNWNKNPRGIKKDKFEELKKRIQRHGQFKPLIITEDGEVLGGNMRLRAMKELGITDVWVSVVYPKTDAEKIEIALVDNEEMGYYEDQALAELISRYKDEIQLDNYSIHLSKPTSLDDLLQQYSPDEIIEDEAPELGDNPPVSKLGEVYQLGRHRLMCGDATKIEDVEKLMDGNKADMVFTDPPYFVGLTSTGLTISQADKKNILHFFTAWLSMIKNYAKGHWYICTDWRTYPVLYFDVISTLGRMTNMIVWDFEWIKAGSQYRFTHELIMFGDRENKVQVPRGEADVWRIQAENFTQKRYHGAQKPIKLLTRAIKNSSKQDDIVLDIFGGSGSTLIACEQTDRICYMMELDPKYCDVIRKRYAKFIEKEDEWQTITHVIV